MQEHVETARSLVMRKLASFLDQELCLRSFGLGLMRLASPLDTLPATLIRTASAVYPVKI